MQWKSHLTRLLMQTKAIIIKREVRLPFLPPPLDKVHSKSQTTDTFCLAGSTSWRRGFEAARPVASAGLWLEGRWRSTDGPPCRTTASPADIRRGERSWHPRIQSAGRFWANVPLTESCPGSTRGRSLRAPGLVGDITDMDGRSIFCDSKELEPAVWQGVCSQPEFFRKSRRMACMQAKEQLKLILTGF